MSIAPGSDNSDSLSSRRYAAPTSLVFCDPNSGSLVRLEVARDDYVWVALHVPHREENRCG